MAGGKRKSPEKPSKDAEAGPSTSGAADEPSKVIYIGWAWLNKEVESRWIAAVQHMHALICFCAVHAISQCSTFPCA
jgi:hypothetical protein